MTEVWFYHLEAKMLDQVLPELLERSLSRKWRAVVRVGSRQRLEALDSHLWTYRDDSFLAHGSSAEPQSAFQPILLTLDATAPNGADILFLVDGAEAFDLDGFKRCVDLFDGRDPAAVEAARSRWRSAVKAGHEVTYWQQTESGKWEKRA